MGVDVEVSDGKLFGGGRTGELILGLLLEGLGLDAVVRFGDVALWEETIAAAERGRKAGG